jgi:hypothetical protein
MSLGKQKPKSTSRKYKVAGPSLGPVSARTTRQKPCSKPLRDESRVRAEKAEREGVALSTLTDLRCECGEYVGACHKPWMGGPKGSPLVPTSHYQRKPPRPKAYPKTGPSKSF